MDFRSRFLLIAVLAFFLNPSQVLSQESDKYSLTPAPDLWYNDVDGIRAGIRLLGEMEGSFKDGPHRLDLGVWLGTWFPDQPLSYYVSFIEPVPAWGDYGNEASFELISSIRTGYSKHGLWFNKRWQPSFDEYNYTELRLGGYFDNMYDDDYRPYPQLWAKDDRSMLNLLLLKRIHTNKTRTLITAEANYQLSADSPTSGAELEVLQVIPLNDSFKIRTRYFAAITQDESDPQNTYMLSMDSPINWMNNGISRAKGTVSQDWLRAGSFQVGGGANIRALLNSEINALNAGLLPLYKSIIAFNFEMEYPNPMDKAINTITLVGDLIDLRSYIFADVAKGLAHTLSTTPELDLVADAGLGFQFSVNVPDYLAKDRAIFVRYDIPLWLKEGLDSSFSFRQLVGLGAIFSF